MIVREKPTWLDLAFALRGSIVPAVAPQVIVLTALAAAWVWFDRTMAELPAIDGMAFTVFGIALSLFLGFRNNAAYDRWWEARKLWGGLLADMRSLAREVDMFCDDPSIREQALRLALAFLHLHRAQLRELPADPRARELGARFSDAPNPPDAALDTLANLFGEARRAGILDGYGARALGERMGSMALQQAGCERIAKTPLPYVYSLLIYRTTYLYCLLLPLALVGPAGWLTPLVVAIVAYVFLGLAEVTEELSQPFGFTTNGLPLDAICRAAEISLAPHLGEKPQPYLRARNFYLS